MLKYQVRSSGTLNRNALNKSSFLSIDRPSSSLQEVPVRFRSNSLSSLSSVDSGDLTEWGILKVYTGDVKADTDYKCLRISTSHTAKNVIDMLLSKFRVNSRDHNLFELYMEVRTMINGKLIKSLLLLTDDSRPLELQRCHPMHMSRFILTISSNGVLVRIHDFPISPMSNYKSVMLARRTSAYEAIAIVLSMNRRNSSPSDYRLFVSDSNQAVALDDTVADLYEALRPDQKLILRRHRQ
ncbi:hypothetical protein AB6A40_008456 [Gnathostoma spinigerum]|uniref:Ras-associating domain-containing protein n=1 Tax=Gnathostoma spinigerum TaxID=75299 RepID=A0ABD6ERH8_9BILA